MRRWLVTAALVAIVASGARLERSLDAPTLARRTRSVRHSGSPFAVIAGVLHLNELARGFLWIQFFGDSTHLLANYHRLLPLLDAITWLDPTDLDTWGLKTQMRLQRGFRDGDAQLVERAIAEMEEAMRLNPTAWELRYDLARQLLTTLASPGRALPYAERAAAMPAHELAVERLEYHLWRALGRPRTALSALDRLLARPDLEPPTRAMATRQREWMLRWLERPREQIATATLAAAGRSDLDATDPYDAVLAAETMAYLIRIRDARLAASTVSGTRPPPVEPDATVAVAGPGDSGSQHRTVSQGHRDHDPDPGDGQADRDHPGQDLHEDRPVRSPSHQHAGSRPAEAGPAAAAGEHGPASDTAPHRCADDRLLAAFRNLTVSSKHQELRRRTMLCLALAIGLIGAGWRRTRSAGTTASNPVSSPGAKPTDDGGNR